MDPLEGCEYERMGELKRAFRMKTTKSVSDLVTFYQQILYVPSQIKQCVLVNRRQPVQVV